MRFLRRVRGVVCSGICKRLSRPLTAAATRICEGVQTKRFGFPADVCVSKKSVARAVGRAGRSGAAVRRAHRTPETARKAGGPPCDCCIRNFLAHNTGSPSPRLCAFLCTQCVRVWVGRCFFLPFFFRLSAVQTQWRWLSNLNAFRVYLSWRATTGPPHAQATMTKYARPCTKYRE